MVLDVLLAAAVGGFAGSAVQAAVNWLNTSNQIEAETNRRRAEFYLQHKVEVLTELHKQLELSRQTYLRYWYDLDELSKEQFQKEIMGSFEDYESAMSKASIFLDNEQQEKLNRVLESFRNANGQFSQLIFLVENSDKDLSQFEWDHSTKKEFDEAVEEGRNVLRGEINSALEPFE